MEWIVCRVCGTIIIFPCPRDTNMIEYGYPVSLSVCVRKSECECRRVVVSLAGITLTAVSPCSLSYLCHISDTLIPVM